MSLLCFGKCDDILQVQLWHRTKATLVSPLNLSMIRFACSAKGVSINTGPHRDKSWKWKWSVLIFHTLTQVSFVNSVWIFLNLRLLFYQRERRRDWRIKMGQKSLVTGFGAKLFHRTHAWANSLFLEVDGVFCEVVLNLRNGDRQLAKWMEGKMK